jgi:hypothetical protein
LGKPPRVLKYSQIFNKFIVNSGYSAQEPSDQVLSRFPDRGTSARYGAGSNLGILPAGDGSRSRNLSQKVPMMKLSSNSIFEPFWYIWFYSIFSR